MSARPPTSVSSEFRLILAPQDAANYKYSFVFFLQQSCAQCPLLLTLVKNTSLVHTLDSCTLVVETTKGEKQ